MFPFSTTIPTVASIASGLPPVLYVITGVPQAKDSTLVVGKVSSHVGFTNTSAIEYILTSSSTFSVLLMPIIFSGNDFI